MPSCAAARSYNRLLEAVTRFVHGACHSFPLFQACLEPAEATGIGVLARRDAGHALEQPLQMAGTLADLRRQLGQRQRLLVMLLDVPARLLHDRHLLRHDFTSVREHSVPGGCVSIRFLRS